MAIFSLNFHDKSKVSLSAIDNDNSFSQADVRDMLARINALEARMEELLRDYKPCRCGSVPLPKQPSLFGRQ